MKISVGIVAPSAQVPRTEFELGVERMKASGFSVRVHRQVWKSSLFFAGPDEARAQAFFEYAVDDRFDVLWCARGGYGAMRILPLLDRLTAEREIPAPKLLIGYSDATALLEFARVRWGWPVIHGPMPGMRRFCGISDSEWGALVSLIRGQLVSEPWSGTRLKFAGKAPTRSVTGPLVGGNLSLLAALVGTQFEFNTRGKILFLEDLDETLYRVDRMVQQLRLAGALDRVKAIVLGDFLNCPDRAAKVLAKRPGAKDLQRVIHHPRPEELKLLRKELPAVKTLHRIFQEVADPLGIPLAYGLPAGHGPGYAPVPLGGEAVLSPDGRLQLKAWEWARLRGQA